MPNPDKPKSNRRNNHPVQQDHSSVEYVRKIGGGLGIIALGIAVGLADSRWYWYGVATAYLGFLFLFAEVVFTKGSLRSRVILGTLCLLFVVLFSTRIVGVDAPIEVALSAGDGNYESGSDVHGIRWEKGMTELSITILNPTDLHYRDLDILLRPDVPTRKVVQTGGTASVGLDLVKKWGEAEVANSRVQGIDKEGKVVVDGPVEIYASTGGFLLHCSDLPPHSRVEMLAAVVNPMANPTLKPTFTNDPQSLAGPKRRVHAVYVNSTYTALYRPRQLEYTFGVE